MLLSNAPEPTDLTNAQFERISLFVKESCGINLHTGKRELVRARLSKRLRKLGMSSFGQYMDRVRQDRTGGELTLMLDAISTNLTSFFREPAHFDYLAEHVIAPAAKNAVRGNRQIRLWSAGCSTGEEPYSMAVTLCESIPDLQHWDAKILATDLSTDVLARAAEGAYPKERLDTVPPLSRSKYFSSNGRGVDRHCRVNGSLRKLVHFARLNLMGHWPMSGPFDAIFCRNVMIYFDKPTQGRLIGRFWDLLASGGTLFIGHSESLAGVQHRFQYVQPTVYAKP